MNTSTILTVDAPQEKKKPSAQAMLLFDGCGWLAMGFAVLTVMLFFAIDLLPTGWGTTWWLWLALLASLVPVVRISAEWGTWLWQLSLFVVEILLASFFLVSMAFLFFPRMPQVILLLSAIPALLFFLSRALGRKENRDVTSFLRIFLTTWSALVLTTLVCYGLSNWWKVTWIPIILCDIGAFLYATVLLYEKERALIASYERLSAVHQRTLSLSYATKIWLLPFLLVWEGLVHLFYGDVESSL